MDDWDKLRMWKGVCANAGAVVEAVGPYSAEKMRDLVSEGFRRRRDPYGAPWAPKKRPNGYPVLHGATGQLEAPWNIQGAGARWFVEPNVDYAAAHQAPARGRGGKLKRPRRMMVPSGRRGMPRRWSSEIRKVSERIMKEYFEFELSAGKWLARRQATQQRQSERKAARDAARASKKAAKQQLRQQQGIAKLNQRIMTRAHQRAMRRAEVATRRMHKAQKRLAERNARKWARAQQRDLRRVGRLGMRRAEQRTRRMRRAEMVAERRVRRFHERQAQKSARAAARKAAREHARRNKRPRTRKDRAPRTAAASRKRSPRARVRSRSSFAMRIVREHLRRMRDRLTRH